MGVALLMLACAAGFGIYGGVSGNVNALGGALTFASFGIPLLVFMVATREGRGRT